MNYIIFDLEWNQSSSPYNENDMLPFEIIEIGAVKLDHAFRVVDEFSSIVRPCVYKKLHNRIREMLSYDETLLKTGQPFYKVCNEFLEWCGEPGTYTFGTWGPLDLYYLQQNMDFYGLEKLETPLRFLDIQLIYEKLNKEEVISKLEKAVTSLKIPVDEPFHMAISDAKYTAKVFSKMKVRHLEDWYQVDYYNNPKTIEEEIITYHKKYMEHITREFYNRIEVMEDREISALKCNKCNRPVNVKIRWFSNNQAGYLSSGRCWYHGYVMGRIKFKNTFDDKVFAIKTVEQISKIEFDKLKERQEQLRIKRKEKRHAQNENKEISE